MNAYSSIEVEAVESLPPGPRILVVAIENQPPFMGIRPEHGQCEAEIDGDRMRVSHPERGWIHRPLEGLNSWHQAWDNLQVNIWILYGDRYRAVEDWNEVCCLPT